MDGLSVCFISVSLLMFINIPGYLYDQGIYVHEVPLEIGIDKEREGERFVKMKIDNSQNVINDGDF